MIIVIVVVVKVNMYISNNFNYAINEFLSGGFSIKVDMSLSLMSNLNIVTGIIIIKQN